MACTVVGQRSDLLEFHCHQCRHQHWGAAGGSNGGQAGAGKTVVVGLSFLRIEKGKMFTGGTG